MPTGKHEHVKIYDLNKLKEVILNDKLFGFVQVDIETPENIFLRCVLFFKIFPEMCPIFS